MRSQGWSASEEHRQAREATSEEEKGRAWEMGPVGWGKWGQVTQVWQAPAGMFSEMH